MRARTGNSTGFAKNRCHEDEGRSASEPGLTRQVTQNLAASGAVLQRFQPVPIGRIVVDPTRKALDA